jgi:hypothetical protein
MTTIPELTTDPVLSVSACMMFCTTDCDTVKESNHKLVKNGLSLIKIEPLAVSLESTVWTMLITKTASGYVSQFHPPLILITHLCKIHFNIVSSFLQ